MTTEKYISHTILSVIMLLTGNACSRFEVETASPAGRDIPISFSASVDENRSKGIFTPENFSRPGHEIAVLDILDDGKFYIGGANGGETFTYLAFALLGPEDIGFHLEDGTSETAEAWLVTDHQPGGWRVVTCAELPAGVTADSLSLSVTDYGSPEEKTVLLSDWGEPMSSEELRAVGVYEIEGHLALVGGGRTVKSSSQYGFNVGLGLIGGEVQKPGENFPILEHAAQLFQFYAADGTPLAESMGKEMEFFMDPGTLKVRFALADGTDADQEIARLKELAPYMVYTGGDGEVLSFPLNLDD